jgi:zinc/manganese transport system substrate-binding protein
MLLGAGLMALCQAQAEGTLHIVATTEHYASIAAIVGADRVRVAYLARGDEDPQAITPKRSYTALCNRADLLIVNGQGLEAAWLPTVLADAANSRIVAGQPGYLDASTGVDLMPLQPDEVQRPLFFSVMTGLAPLLGRQRQEEASGNHRYYWLDPANGAIIARTLAERLALLDPANATFYQANAAQFAATLQERLPTWDAMLHPFAGIELVSVRHSWTYLARRHGLKIVATLVPREPLVLGPTNVSRPPGRDAIAFLMARMQQRAIRLMLAETYHDLTLVQPIATQMGAQLLWLPAAVSQRQGLRDYFQFFERLYHELARALQGART